MKKEPRDLLKEVGKDRLPVLREYLQGEYNRHSTYLMHEVDLHMIYSSQGKCKFIHHLIGEIDRVMYDNGKN